MSAKTTIRLVSWNCHHKLHAKWDALMGFRPSLAVVPECARPEILQAKEPAVRFAASDRIDTSRKNKDQGLGVFSFGSLTLSGHWSWSDDFEAFVPIRVGGEATLNLLADWALSGGDSIRKASLNASGT